MSARVRLEPLGITIEVDAGTALRDVLFAHAVEFPCGGRGVCRGCRVRFAKGAGEPTADDRLLLAADEIGHGWRLACRSRIQRDVVLEIDQWAVPVLVDDRPLPCEPREGFGIAVDVGTTTLVAQLVDLRTARVRGVRTALNPQGVRGSDIMSRVQAALLPEGARALRDAIRLEVGRMVCGLTADAGDAPALVVLAGNTVMHHLFSGIDVAPLAESPFETPHGEARGFTPIELDWPLPPSTEVAFLPCLGGFVGSDVLCGIRALRLDGADEIAALVDLGTNAEIVLGSREGLLCASTAAGPAFEGGRIAAGMRAATGAISEVQVAAGAMRCHVLGGGAPRGLCGSGLVDAVRCGIDLGRILPSGRLAGGARTLHVCGDVHLLQADIREVQLAKAAIAAGFRLLLARLGASPRDVTCVHLAGAFGNYVGSESAHRIGLLPVPPDRIHPAGNTALLGAKLALFDSAPDALVRLRSRVCHLPLAASPDFQSTYVDSMAFRG